MLKGFLMVLSGYLGKWVYEFFSGRRAKSQSLVTYIFPGLFALVWCFIAIVGFLGLFFDLGGSTRDAALMFGGCVAVAVVLWLACLPLRIAEKKKVAEKEAEEQAEIQRQAEYREENGVAPLLCDVDGYVECPQCHTRQKLGREKCFGCDVLFKSTPIKQQPTETAEKAGAEIVTHDTNGESEHVGPVPTPRPLFCRKCGAKLQTDSLFCGACGAEIIHTEQDPSQDVSIYAEENSQSIPTGFIRKGTFSKMSRSTNTTIPGDISKKEHKKSPLRIALIVIAAVGLLLLSALNVFQFVMHKNDQERIAVAEQANKELSEKLAEQDRNNSEKIEALNSQIASKDATIADKDKKIQSQEKTISSQNSKISSYETKADYYTTICDELKSGNIGYAASNFNCSQSIILVKKGQTKKITLTANWTNGGTVSYSYSSYAATVDFDQNNWTYSTKLSIEGFYSGVNVVTFSNNVDSKTFKIIIIVE